MQPGHVTFETARDSGRLDQAVLEAPAADNLPEVVGTRTPSNSEQPRPCAGTRLEDIECPKCPQVGLLGEIVGGTRIYQRRRQPPDLRLRGPHERGLGCRVAVTSKQRPTSYLVWIWLPDIHETTHYPGAPCGAQRGYLRFGWNFRGPPCDY